MSLNLVRSLGHRAQLAVSNSLSNLWNMPSVRKDSCLLNQTIMMYSSSAQNEISLGRYRRAKRIILIRHGESMGNVDENNYVHTADWRIPLSDTGIEQSKDAGRRLRNIMLLNKNHHNGDDSLKKDAMERCFIYYSPYLRTTQTMEYVCAQLPPGAVIGRREEPRIVEQQFGNFQNLDEIQEAKEDRVRFGRFFYRFAAGEAGLDVYTRTTSFIGTMSRDVMEMQRCGLDMDKTNLVIVTHGLSMRLFLMRWLQISVKEFDRMYNPDNAFMAVMERHVDINEDNCTREYYQLTEESAKHLKIKKRKNDSYLDFF